MHLSSPPGNSVRHFLLIQQWKFDKMPMHRFCEVDSGKWLSYNCGHAGRSDVYIERMEVNHENN